MRESKTEESANKRSMGVKTRPKTCLLQWWEDESKERSLLSVCVDKYCMCKCVCL